MSFSHSSLDKVFTGDLPTYSDYKLKQVEFIKNAEKLQCESLKSEIISYMSSVGTTGKCILYDEFPNMYKCPIFTELKNKGYNFEIKEGRNIECSYRYLDIKL